MFGIQGKSDGTLGRIARIREEFETVSRLTVGLPYGQGAHYSDAFNRLAGMFLAGDMEARMFGANVAELIKDAESAARKEAERKRAERRVHVQRAAARMSRRERANA